MSGDLVLITGGSGLIGIKTIHLALEAGYSVRAAVRSQAKADLILATPTVKAINPGPRLTFITVPDMLADGAYDDAVKGAKYIMHIASGTIHGDDSESDYDAHFIQPALKGTLGILDSAFNTISVKRVIITSSEVGIIPWEEFSQKEVDTVFDGT
jgi:nucleoside-diphosphate-sugar epimerase